MAALPTAPIERAENKNGSIPPKNKPAITTGLATSIVVIPAVDIKAAKRAKAVSAAEPMAKPLPMAAVVLPTASSLSVRLRTSLSKPLISAIPPALSEIGP